MLNAPTETTAPRITPRQSPTRDARQAPEGFSTLVDDNATARTDASRPRPAREPDAPSRATSSQRPRDARDQDERAAQASDRASASDDRAASDVRTEAEKTDSPADKPIKERGDAAEKTSIEALDLQAADAPVVDPAPVAGSIVTPDPAVVAAPVVPTQVAPPPGSAPAPLAIAAAGLAAAKAATSKSTDLPKPTDVADAVPTAEAADSAAATGMSGDKPKPVAAEPITLKVETGLKSSGEKAAIAADANASTAATAAVPPKPAPNGEATATVKAKETVEDATPGALPKPTHEHRAAGAVPGVAPEASLTGTPAIAPQTSTSAAQAISPTTQLTATVATAAPVPLNGLAVELAARAQSGASRFDIRLDPAELGRIDVRIDIDRHGQVTSHLTVEKPETLAMLRQDSPQLQRALNDAGLKTADGALQFTLGDQSQPRQNTDSGQRQTQNFIVRDDDTVVPAAPVRSYGRMFAARSGVDISV